MSLRSAVLIVLLLVLGGCGSSERDAWRAYRDAFALGDYAKAKELLDKSNLKEEKSSRLLWLMESGRLAYAAGDFKNAQTTFNEAIELIDAQYTKSATREASKWLINDRSGEFFGSTYERSWLFYHQSMSNWRLYQEGNLPDADSKRHLFAARAGLLAWDSFFQDWQRSSMGKSLYRHDLTAKIVAAEVHEATGVRADLQISLQLYKDAWKLLEGMGFTYPVFNSDALEFSKSLATALNNENEFKLPKDHRAATPFYKESRDYLLQKIVSLTLILRPGEMAQVQKQLGFTNEELSAAKKHKSGNVVFLLEEGVVPPKVGKQISLGIQGLAALSKDSKTSASIARAGSEILGYFAADILGMTPRHTGVEGNYAATHGLMTLAAHEAAIEFEIPAIESGSMPQPFWVQVKDAKGKALSCTPWPVVTHLEDLARQNLEEESSQRILRTGVRVGTKYIAAIVSAFAIYQGLKKNGELLAKYAAVAAFIGASKGIAATERADVRAWLTLPRTLRLTSMELAPGAYQVDLGLMENEAFKSLRELGKFTVVKDKRAIFTYALPQI